jgi:hypothetical protein
MAKKIDHQSSWVKTFSHREAAAVAGVSPEALLLYNKRGFLPAADFPAVVLGRETGGAIRSSKRSFSRLHTFSSRLAFRWPIRCGWRVG